MHDHPALVALLRGELSNADVTEVGHHVDCCDECDTNWPTPLSVTPG